jgi:hypothetical protein
LTVLLAAAMQQTAVANIRNVVVVFIIYIF